MTGPLTGFIVFEQAPISTVAFAGALLAYIGADVVRVDRLPDKKGGRTSDIKTVVASYAKLCHTFLIENPLDKQEWQII